MNTTLSTTSRIAICMALGAIVFLLTIVPIALAHPLATNKTTDTQAASVVLAKTVGTDGSACATTSSITLPPGGGLVFYCYRIQNTGSVTLTRHSLVDNKLGTLLNGLSYSLVPGASAFITQNTTITQTTINTATWTAYNPGPIDLVSSSDVALVNVSPTVSAVVLTKTVGTNPGICSTRTTITLTVSSPVFYCYTILNIGNITLTRHTLTDNRLGTLLNSLAYSLSPGASAFLTATTLITQTTVNTATWTAFNPGPVNTTVSIDAAKVIIPTKMYLPTVLRQ